jgi:hypothetical protein
MAPNVANIRMLSNISRGERLRGRMHSLRVKTGSRASAREGEQRRAQRVTQTPEVFPRREPRETRT